VRLPSKGDRDLFPITVSLSYQVDDPRRIVEEHVEDTEELITAALHPVLRDESRRFALNKYNELLPLLEAAIAPKSFKPLGLKLNMPIDVTIHLDPEAHERVKQLNDVERATRVVQHQIHQVQLPSKDLAYDFEARVAVTYRVTEVDQLPVDNLVETEAMLWSQVETALRAVSRQFGVDQVFEAEQKMQEIIEGQSIQGYGLEIVKVQVAVDLDKRAREYAEELAQLDHEVEMRREALGFYGSVTKEGWEAVLSFMFSTKPEDAEQILSRLEEKERRALEARLVEMEILKDMAEKGGAIWEEPAEQALERLMGMLRGPVKPEARQLEAGEGGHSADDSAGEVDSDVAGATETDDSPG